MRGKRLLKLYRWVESILARGGYLIIDTNVLLALLITKNKPAESNLGKMVARGVRLVVTPQLLAEFFSLKEREGCPIEQLESALKALLAASEKYTPKDRMLSDAGIREFGVTDLSILEALNAHEYERRVFLVTDDERLRFHCQKLGLPAISSVDVESFHPPG